MKIALSHDIVNLRIYNIYFLSCAHRANHHIIGGREVAEILLILDKLMFAVPSHLLVLHMLGNGFQKDFFTALLDS